MSSIANGSEYVVFQTSVGYLYCFFGKSIFRNTVKSVQASGAAGGERERRADKPSTEDTARCRHMEDTERF